LAGKVIDQWVNNSIKQYHEAADAIGCALIGLGIKPGDKVATIAVSTPE
jgi:long-subunit acyl-CoA synthetase (AMP-forming)